MHTASMRRDKNARHAKKALKSQGKAVGKTDAKAKPMPGARAGVRKPTKTTPKHPAAKALKPATKVIKPNKGTKAVAAVAAAAPSWERHVKKLPVPFPLRRFDLGAMSDEELAACSKAMGIRLSLAE